MTSLDRNYDFKIAIALNNMGVRMTSTGNDHCVSTFREAVQAMKVMICSQNEGRTQGFGCDVNKDPRITRAAAHLSSGSHRVQDAAHDRDDDGVQSSRSFSHSVHIGRNEARILEQDQNYGLASAIILFNMAVAEYSLRRTMQKTLRLLELSFLSLSEADNRQSKNVGADGQTRVVAEMTKSIKQTILINLVLMNRQLGRRDHAAAYLHILAGMEEGTEKDFAPAAAAA